MFGPVICTVAVNLFLSALGIFFKKSFHALSSAAFAIFIASAIFIRNYEIFFQLNVRVRFQVRMVVLTVVAPSNEHTVYFDQPIPKPNYISLLSCSLYNSWFNLKRTGEISVFDDNKKAATVLRLTEAHYSLEKITKDLSDVFTSNGFELSTEINTSVGQLIIRIPKNKIKNYS